VISQICLHIITIRGIDLFQRTKNESCTTHGDQGGHIVPLAVSYGDQGGHRVPLAVSHGDHAGGHRVPLAVSHGDHAGGYRVPLAICQQTGYMHNGHQKATRV